VLRGAVVHYMQMFDAKKIRGYRIGCGVLLLTGTAHPTVPERILAVPSKTATRSTQADK